MKNRFHSLLQCVAALSIGGITFTHAAEQFWNPAPLSDNWAGSVWSATSGGGALTTWAAANDAVFDQAGTYTATINADQTATNTNIKAGAIAFAGTNTAASNNLTIDSGASLSADSDRFLKVGTTVLTVTRTLTQTAAVTNNASRVSIAGGNGRIVLSGGFRTSGDFNFAGNNLPNILNCREYHHCNRQLAGKRRERHLDHQCRKPQQHHRHRYGRNLVG